MKAIQPTDRYLHAASRVHGRHMYRLLPDGGFLFYMCTEMHELLADKRISREDKAAARNLCNRRRHGSLCKKRKRGMPMNSKTTGTAAPQALSQNYQFNLSDFALFLSVMKNKTAYESTLSIILDEPDLKLTEVEVEQVVLNKSGKRAIRLDAWARDVSDRRFNTEMQNDTEADDVRRRARFYQGLLDTPVLKAGKTTRYKHLPSTVIIFITQEDIFGRDRAIYTFTEQCEEFSDLPLDDGTKKIFLNMTSKNGRPELISLLQYMKNTTIDNPEVKIKDKRIITLDEIVNEVKQSEEWEAVKMNILEIGIKKGRQEGLQEGLKQGIHAMIQDNLEEGVEEKRICEKLQKNFSLTREAAEEELRSFMEEKAKNQ